MTTPTKVYSFDEVTRLTETGPGTFEGEINDQWTIGGKPNGGYLLAMLGRAASAPRPEAQAHPALSEHPHVIAASAHYLTAPDPGPVSIAVEVLRSGRTASQSRARMAQAGKGIVEALITTSQLDPDAKPYWDAGAPRAGEVGYEECRPLDPLLPNGVRVAIMDQVEIRLEPRFASRQPTGRGELRGWLSLPGGAAFTPTSLLYAVDAFPPATFDIEFSGWMPTLELTAYVRALPAPGPVQIVHRAQLIDGHRADETCFVWDRTGRLVAHSTQLAGIRLG